MIHYSILWTDSCVGKREDLRLILLGFDEDNGLYEGVCGCWVTLEAPLEAVLDLVSESAKRLGVSRACGGERRSK